MPAVSGRRRSSSACPPSASRRSGDGQRPAGAGIARRHRPREGGGGDPRQARQLAHPLAGAGAPEHAGHHHRRGEAPRHHHEAQRVPRVAGAALSFHSARLTISIRRVPVSATAAAPSTNPSASAAPILCRSSKGMKRAPSGVTSSAPHGRAETRPPPPPPPSLSSFLPPPPPKA